MPIETNYDENGNAKTVVLSHEEYQSLLARPDERVIIDQTASKITDLIQHYIRSQESGGELDSSPEIDQSEADFVPAPEDQTPEEKPAPVDVRRYKNAIGYYDSYGFRVLKGSKATGYPSDTFERKVGASFLRKELIKRGILARDGGWGDYTFTQDYLFNNPSAAACIVDGNSRSGPDAWGRRRH